MSNRTIVTRLRAEMAQFKREWDSGTKSVTAAADAMDRAAKKAGGASKVIDESGTAVGRLTASLRNNRAEWDTVGTSLLRTGAALTALSVLTVKAAMDWESAWTGVTKTTSGSERQMAQLEAGLRGLAKTLPESHAGIAAVAEAAGQLGVKRENIVGFTKTMVDLGETTNLTADEAATSLAQFMNIMGTAPDMVDNLGSSLVALGNDGASTEREILEMAQRIAGAGKIVGLSEGDVLGLSNALASVGIEADAGGSSVSAILIDISKAVATNSDDLAKWAAVSGMSVDEFAAKWKTSPAEGFAAFTEGLGEVNAAGGDVFSTLEQLGQTDIRVTRALLGMAASGDLLRNSFRTGNVEMERNNALSAEAEKRYDTAAAKAQIAWNGIKDNAIDAGQAVLPVVAEVAEVVSNLASVFGQLPGPVKGGLGALTGVAGVSLLAIGGLMKAAGAVSDFRSSLRELGGEAPRTGRALGLLARGLTVIAGAATAAKVLESWDHIDVAGVNKFTRGLLDAAKGSDKLLNSISSNGNSGIFGLNRNAVDGIADAFNKAADASGKVDLSFASDSDWDRAKGYVEQVDQALVSLVQSGAVEDAAAAFAYLRDETGKSGKELQKLLPGYTDTLEGIDVQQKLAGDSAQKLGGDLDALSPEAQKAKDDLEQLKQSTTEVALSFLDFTKGLDSNKLSYKEWVKGLQEMAEAQRNWQDNMLTAQTLGATDETLAKFRELGPAGAKMLDEMVKGGQSSIEEFNALMGDAELSAGRFSTAITGKLAEIPAEIRTAFVASGDRGAIQKAAAVAHEYELTPSEVKTVLKANDWATADIKAVLAHMAELDRKEANPKVGVDIGGALGQINLLQRTINGMNGKTIRVAVKGGTGGGITQDADGSIHTPRGRITRFANGGMRDVRDQHVAEIAPAGAMRLWAEPETGGEAYIPLSAAKRPRSRSIAEQTVQILGGTIQWFADGGINPASKLDIKQAEIQVRDIQRSLNETEKYGKKPKKGKDTRPRRRVLRGADRELAELQLAEAKRELRDLKNDKAYKTDQAEKAAEAAEKARDDAQKIADEAAAEAERVESNRLSVKAGYASNFKIGSLSSTAAVDRTLERTLADAGTFLGLLGDLKSKGASPWLLQQLVEAGPTKSAIKLARQYATDSAALARVNATASQIDSLTNSYANLVTNPAFTAPQAWSSGVSTQSVSKSYEINAYSPAEVAAEFYRLIRFHEQNEAMEADA
ncbi:phage tail tape measure protein [Aeromicrobium endophyticum]|uniref:phage tail tape measure protein n=1 Tax=Aeromicrobium endophyticum TaxID=2292704 RepID=UPI00131462C3|nr:phage tail tape measure protein [Aeromicrobium endophyticum]